MGVDRVIIRRHLRLLRIPVGPFLAVSRQEGKPPPIIFGTSLKRQQRRRSWTLSNRKPLRGTLLL